MNGGPSWLKPLIEAAGSKRVLLVEGSRDESTLERWLALIDPGFRERLLVRRPGDLDDDKEFGGTEKVKQGLKHRDDWYGLVDRDERTESEIAADELRFPNLRFLPRYCLENYFILPAEILACIPAAQRDRHPNAADQISRAIESHVDRWVAHWCMWRTLRQREQELRKALVFPDQVIKAVLDRHPLAEAEIKEMLQVWHEHFEPSHVYREYADRMAEATARPLDDRLKHFIHGKLFFRQVVVPDALADLAKQSADAWFQNLIASYPSVPDDMIPLLEGFLG